MKSRRYIAILCLAALLPSCRGWAAPQPAPPSPDRSRVRVTTFSGERFVLKDPFTAGESYAGELEGAGAWRAPLDSIRTFEVEEFSGVRTLVFLGITGAVTVAISLVSLNYALQHR